MSWRPGAALLGVAAAAAINWGLGAAFLPLWLVGLAGLLSGPWLALLGAAAVASKLSGWAAAAASLCLGLGARSSAAAWMVRPRIGAGFTFTLAVIGTGILAATSGVPKGGVLAIPGSDKVLHLALYGAVAATAVDRFERIHPAWVLGAWALVATVDELGQRFLPHRTSDPYDWLATMSGIVFAGGLSALRLTWASSGPRPWAARTDRPRPWWSRDRSPTPER